MHAILINKLSAFRIQILIWESSYLHGAPTGPTQFNRHAKLKVGGSVAGESPDTGADGPAVFVFVFCFFSKLF